MKKVIGMAGALGLLLLLTSVALGHGGGYTGPAGTGSPGNFAPAGTGTPGPGPGPAGTGTGGSGTTGSGNGGTTSGGAPIGGGPTRPGGSGGATAGGTAAPRAGVTGGGSKKPASDANATWAAWWFFNDDKYLNLKARIRATQTETDNADIFVGKAGVDTITRVPAKKIREEVNPVLKFALKDPYFDTRAAASIALGKTGMPDALPEIMSTVDDDDKRVRESACLAAGILGNKEAIPQLIEIMSNSAKARKDLGRGTSDILTRTRAFAALGIGLIGARDSDLVDTNAIGALIDMVKSKEKIHQDIKVGPVVALGIIRAKEAVPVLRDYYRNKDNDSLVRSYAVTSLGKIGDPSVIPDLVKGLRDKENYVAQSCAIALGLLVDKDDKDAIKPLQKMVKSGRDISARNFAIIALGEIGGIENRNFLTQLLRKSNRFEKTFAAVALGIYSHKNENDPDKIEIAQLLHKAFSSVKNPEERGAYAIALGMMKFDTAGEDILKVLRKGGQASMRQHLCIALGLMGYTEAIKEVQGIVTERGDVNLRRSAAIALGLLGDKGAMAHLQKEIENSSNSLAVHGAVTQGLGFIGDVSAVETLVEMVKDRQGRKDVTRAFAATALGLLGDKDSIPILSRVSENNNYLTRTDAIGELLTIL